MTWNKEIHTYVFQLLLDFLQKNSDKKYCHNNVNHTNTQVCLWEPDKLVKRILARIRCIQDETFVYFLLIYFIVKATTTILFFASAFTFAFGKALITHTLLIFFFWKKKKNQLDLSKQQPWAKFHWNWTADVS